MAETKVENDPKAAKPAPATAPTPAAEGQEAEAPKYTAEELAKAKAIVDAANAAKPKRQKTPIPDGYVAPVEFARKMDEHLKQPAGTTPPQVIYGFIKNSSQFPFEERGAEDFPRFIVKLDDALKFVDGLQDKRAERAAKKAAKDQAILEAAKAVQAQAEAEKQPSK